MQCKKIVCSVIMAIIVQNVSLAEPQIIGPNVVPQGGMVNTHDMNMLKELKRQQDVNRDFKNFQERKKEETKEKDLDKKKKEKKK